MTNNVVPELSNSYPPAWHINTSEKYRDIFTKFSEWTVLLVQSVQKHKEKWTNEGYEKNGNYALAVSNSVLA